MGIRIIVDSAADMSEKESKYLKVLPLKITFGETEYLDGMTISAAEFYEKLIESEDLPKTSQLAPYEFEQAIQEVIAEGDIPIVITISSKLSGTYNSARIAASEFEQEVYVVDSENVCIGERLLVEYAIRMIEEGNDAKSIVCELEKKKKDICLIALLDTLEYLRRGGRISNAAGAVGGMLSIKPVVGVKEGVLETLGKARGSKNANNLLTQQIKQNGEIDFTMPYAVAYSGINDSLIQKYLEDQREIWEAHTESVRIYVIGSTIGTHAGPGAIAFSYFKK